MIPFFFIFSFFRFTLESTDGAEASIGAAGHSHQASRESFRFEKTKLSIIYLFFMIIIFAVPLLLMLSDLLFVFFLCIFFLFFLS